MLLSVTTHWLGKYSASWDLGKRDSVLSERIIVYEQLNTDPMTMHPGHVTPG